MEKYELNWLGKEFAKKQIESPVQTILVEDKEFNKKSENINSENILIKGDNLEALKHLKENYLEKIKMIYIDPPYNTGTKDFVYNDNHISFKYIKELFCITDEEAKQIIKTVNKKELSHSAWMTFMYPRLYLARQLLRNDGIIFISFEWGYKGLVKIDKVSDVDYLFSLIQQSYEETL